MSEERFTLQETHRKHAANGFNQTWDYLDKTDRTLEDEMQMLHTAHASRYHWTRCGDAKNWARGDWQLSRVYAVLGQGENALRFASSCLKLTQENSLGAFDLAFAYEAIARAYTVLDESTKAAEAQELGRQAASDVTSDEDRKYVLSELELTKR